MAGLLLQSPAVGAESFGRGTDAQGYFTHTRKVETQQLLIRAAGLVSAAVPRFSVGGPAGSAALPATRLGFNCT